MKLTKELALKEYTAGSNIRQIGDKYECSKQYVSLLLNQNPSYKKKERKNIERREFNGKKYFLRSDGYFLSTDSSQSLLHREIYKFHNNGKLEKWQDVHHINGDKKDNSPKNLIALSHSEHTRLNAAKIGSIGGKKSKRAITPEQQKTMQNARKPSIIRK